MQLCMWLRIRNCLGQKHNRAKKEASLFLECLLFRKVMVNQKLMIQPVVFVNWLRSEVQTQLLEGIGINRGKHNRGVKLASS